MSEIINIALVEDNPDDRQRLKTFLEQYSARNDARFKFTEFKSGEAFLASGDEYHIVFMDIELPGKNGIETAKVLRSRNKQEVLVMVTNMVQYAIHGYSVRALDYLVKPVVYEQVEMKMPEFIAMSRRKQKYLTLRGKQDTVKVNIKDIRYMEVFNHDVIMQLDSRKVKCYGTLKEYSEELFEYGFVKCSQNCLVNLTYVEGIHGDQICVDGNMIPVSRREKKRFLEAFITFEKGW